MKICLILFIFLFGYTSCIKMRMVSSSMEDTIIKGSTVKVRPSRKFERYSVIAFKNSSKINIGKYQISRIIGIPGDVIEIKKGDVYINNIKIPDLPTVQQYYHIKSKDSIDPDIVEKYRLYKTNANEYNLSMTKEEISIFSKDTNIVEITRRIFPEGYYEYGIYREDDTTRKWNKDNYGPIQIPVKIANKLDFYFVLGDNRSLVFDSRYMGSIAENNIIGIIEEKGYKK